MPSGGQQQAKEGFRPGVRALTLSLAWRSAAAGRPPLQTYGRRPGLASSVPSPGLPWAGDEHPPGMRIPSLPFLLCETEHANPNLTYMGICIFGSDLIASVFMYYLCIIMRTSCDFFGEKYGPYICTFGHPCTLLGPPLTLNSSSSCVTIY